VAPMSAEQLKRVLEELPDPSFVEGTAKFVERFAIALPDGDVGAIDDKRFVEWLNEHAEDAPFGHGGETKKDKKVRNARRLVARGNVEIAGFDPAMVIGEIEAALSPRCHLEATLEDVILYPKGGKFARHKDTPRTKDLVGTLIVGLPILHEGGGFEIVDGGKPHVIDWSGKVDPAVVRWVALFSDLDHAIKPITSGARVTLVYSLARSTRPRVDPARDKHLTKLRAVASALELPPKQPLMIACTRQIVTDGKQPQSIETLRGTDRAIADTFIEAGFDVAVRACIVGDNGEAETSFPAPANLWAVTRLAKALPDDVVAGMDSIVSFDDIATDDEIPEDANLDSTLLGQYVLDTVRMDRWVIRKRAAATVVYEGMYSETGYFGNEASFGHLYTLAAIEVTAAKKRSAPKPAAKAKPKAKPKSKAKPKRR
jgi:hypothetical protein